MASAGSAPIIRSSIPSPLTSPALLTENPELSPASIPLITNPLFPFSDDKFNVLPKDSEPNITYVSPASSLPLGSAKNAPIIRSSKPSPLISPALLTENPELSNSSIPLITNPLLPSRDDKFNVSSKEEDPNTTYVSPASILPLGCARNAPIIRSSKPSPLISPALLTENPELSNSSIPLITNPLFPSSDDKFNVFPKDSEPNITYVSPAKRLPLGSAPYAPIIKSSIPSPLTSPALLTDLPE